MTLHPLLPAEAELTALRDEMHRTARQLRRVARDLRSTPERTTGTTRRPLALRVLRGGLWPVAR